MGTDVRVRADQAVEKIREAVEIRKQITELYGKYRELSNIACYAAQLNHHDLKRAVDALYYLGGGWPKPTSKGRMEALLDNFVGMYRILHFIGSGGIVEQHLAKYGVTVKLDLQFAIDDGEIAPNDRKYIEQQYKSHVFESKDLLTVKDIVSAVIVECQDLQREICGLADTIKDGLRVEVKDLLEIDEPEYNRLHDMVKLGMTNTPRADEKAVKKKHGINVSFTGMNAGMAAISARKT